MNIIKLIKHLEKFKDIYGDAAIVKAYDADSEQYEEITGFLWDNGPEILLQTDDIS